METTINTRLLPAFKTEAAWALVETIPKAGEILYTSDGANAGCYKIGDGTNTWSNLKYVQPLVMYGTCDTAAATVAKVANNVSNFHTLVTGVTVTIKFTNSNTKENPTLNVNGTGAKAIKRYGTTALGTTATNSWNAGTVFQFTYDGTYWMATGWLNTNSTYSNASLGQGVASQSNTSAATAITASCSSYALSTGGMVMVSFTYDVPASATLNVNSKGAKPIWYRGAAIAQAGIIKAGDRALFMYSGSYYHLLAIDRGASVVPPTVSATQTANGYNLTIVDSNGSNTISINNGTNGSQGPAGYTPVRGTDYWTASDQSAIVSAAVTQVLNQLPAAESNSF